MAPRKRAHDIAGAVCGIVVDEDDLPSNSLERLAQPLHQKRYIAALVESWNYDSEIGWRRRWNRRRNRPFECLGCGTGHVGNRRVMEVFLWRREVGQTPHIP
jgi:hypothetical protein